MRYIPSYLINIYREMGFLFKQWNRSSVRFVYQFQAFARVLTRWKSDAQNKCVNRDLYLLRKIRTCGTFFVHQLHCIAEFHYFFSSQGPLEGHPARLIGAKRLV